MWLIQNFLLYLVFAEFKQGDFSFKTSSYEVLICRILCAILLHLQLEGEIRQSLLMLNYARLHTKHRKQRIPMLIVSLMQFSGAFGTEIINIILICNQDGVQDVLMNFIALGVIAEIDDYYAGTLYKNAVKDRIEDVELIIDESKPEDNAPYQKWYPISILYHVMMTFYKCVYYYFTPFSVIALSILFNSAKATTAEW